MKLEFEDKLDFQLDAIKSITDIFIGQSIKDNRSLFNFTDSGSIAMMGNELVLSDEQLLKNLNAIQQRNSIEQSQQLDGMNFSVEMETGTGKTYVYLRSIYELNQLYGFKKFVIVVPSIAIREGVLKNLQVTHEHFQKLYDKTPFSFQVYDSKRISALRGFASTNSIEVLVINIDSFAKDENIINKTNDRLNGQKPIEFIQACRPIVIVDEPQNMETDKRKTAIAQLNPLCTLRYSATHKTKYNLTYSLNPVDAYDLGLVKQIEVDSVMEENAFNDAFIMLDAIVPAKTRVTAKLFILSNEKNGVKKKKVSIKIGDDLYQKSNQREIYANGYFIEEIDAANQCLTFSNGIIIDVGQSQGGLNDEVMKYQIRKTVDEHFKKQKRLAPLGIKVLSLFFIDKVANYRSYDENGNKVDGKFFQWFEEIYHEYSNKPAFKNLAPFNIATVHDGYFSCDKKGKIKDTNGTTLADNDTYNLIMKDKEKLLDINNSLQFIFSHSALREGWDNPNVFQICTLNETQSEIKKRQEIGRGLRLCVNQQGTRIYDQNINRLTIIANESYDDFAKSLQKEIEQDCGVNFLGRIKKAQLRKPVKYRKGFMVDAKFLQIWEKIKHQTTYRVNYQTSELIRQASKQVNQMPTIHAPSVRSSKVKIQMSQSGIETTQIAENVGRYDSIQWEIPDVLGKIQLKTDLTRSTIKDILTQSSRLSDLLVNPQVFLDSCIKAINHVKQKVMIDGIKYQQIGNKTYEMKLFEAQELEVYLNNHEFKVNNPSKTIYQDFIPLDSGTENKFSQECENFDAIKFYFKLPNWFKIPTPVGNYNPDWAVIFEDENKIYFVAETKNTGDDLVDMNKLKLDEQLKIKCGKAHFEQLEDINYKVVRTVGQLQE